jgi:hypothetical protein
MNSAVGQIALIVLQTDAAHQRLVFAEQHNVAE